MRIFVLGGDGFCGWPTSLHLSKLGHDVTIIDNLSRRKIDIDLEVESLTPIVSISERLNAWEEVSGRSIKFLKIDIANEYGELARALCEEKPEAIVHFAEQRAAPYSMKGVEEKRYTVANNINGTTNLLTALAEHHPTCHLVHLGTMGVYGYDNVGLPIPEGYLPIKLELPDGNLVDKEILYPANPGSVYHLTKTMDQLLFAFYCKNDGITVTDLHQGIVWGTGTPETAMDRRLINRFDYDGDYGTVLNRFLVQAAVGYPLTVHGTGGQTRAFIHIRDTVRCIQLAIDSRPQNEKKVRIFNQMTETHRVRELAEMVAEMAGCEVAYVDNPRKEDAENELDVVGNGLINLGLDPTYLSQGLMNEITDIANKYSARCDKSKIPCVSYWNSSLKK